MGQHRPPKTSIEKLKGGKITVSMEMMGQQGGEPTFQSCQAGSQASAVGDDQDGDKENGSGTGQDFLRRAGRGILVYKSGDEKKDHRPTSGIATGEKPHPAELQHKASHRQYQAEKTHAMQEIGMEKE